MPQKRTGIAIDAQVYEQGKQFAKAQRPRWSFSTLVEIAIEDFLTMQAHHTPKPVVLTDGQTIHKTTQMTTVEIEAANALARQHTDENVWWEVIEPEVGAENGAAVSVLEEVA